MKVSQLLELINISAIRKERYCLKFESLTCFKNGSFYPFLVKIQFST